MGESGIIALGLVIHLSIFSGVQTQAVRAELLHSGGIAWIVGDARRLAPDDAVELGSDQRLGARPDLMADPAFGECGLALGGIALGGTGRRGQGSDQRSPQGKR